MSNFDFGNQKFKKKNYKKKKKKQIFKTTKTLTAKIRDKVFFFFLVWKWGELETAYFGNKLNFFVFFFYKMCLFIVTNLLKKTSRNKYINNDIFMMNLINQKPTID